MIDSIREILEATTSFAEYDNKMVMLDTQVAEKMKDRIEELIEFLKDHDLLKEIFFTLDSESEQPRFLALANYLRIRINLRKIDINDTAVN